MHVLLSSVCDPDSEIWIGVGSLNNPWRFQPVTPDFDGIAVTEAAAYYEDQLSGLGRRFGAEGRRVLDILLVHPEIGIGSMPESRLVCASSESSRGRLTYPP